MPYCEECKMLIRDRTDKGQEIYFEHQKNCELANLQVYQNLWHPYSANLRTVNAPVFAGVYFIMDNNKDVLYIGKSVSNLRARAMGSFMERVGIKNHIIGKQLYPHQYYISTIETTKSDAEVLETYCIAFWKPPFNRRKVENDELKIRLVLPEDYKKFRDYEEPVILPRWINE